MLAAMETEKGEKQKDDDKKHLHKVCEKSFHKSSALVSQKRIHTGETTYECNICEKTFSNSGNLARHKMIHSGQKDFYSE